MAPSDRWRHKSTALFLGLKRIYRHVMDRLKLEWNLFTDSWSRGSIYGDLRNVVIAAATSFVAASVWGIILATMLTETEVRVVVGVDDNGIACPALLFVSAEKDVGTRLNIEPKELMNVAVCDFHVATGKEVTDLLFSYLEKYSMCFWATEKVGPDGIRNITVRPNTASGEMELDAGGYACKCSRVKQALGERWGTQCETS
jgi:hypothetical protein